MSWLETMLSRLQDVFLHRKNRSQVYDRFVAEFAKGFYEEHKKLYSSNPVGYWAQFRGLQEKEWHKFWYKLREAKEDEVR